MGMAASQARLLSITTRMSDNELRAQLINNSKMRLATESAQISESYISALNNAKMMFANHDIEGNTLNQALSFNSLTAFSPSNNQYGLVNSNGSILASERDVNNFKDANGDVNNFLKAYGLEYTTTYFDELKTHELVDNDGKRYVDGNILDADTLSTLFKGGMTPDGVQHIGYEDALTSEAYNNYNTLVQNYETTHDKYIAEMKPYLNTYLKGLTSSTGQTFQQLLDFAANGGSIADGDKSVRSFQDIFNQISALFLDNDIANTYKTDTAERVSNFLSNIVSCNTTFSGNTCVIDDGGVDGNGNRIEPDTKLEIVKDGANYVPKFTMYVTDANGENPQPVVFDTNTGGVTITHVGNKIIVNVNASQTVGEGEEADTTAYNYKYEISDNWNQNPKPQATVTDLDPHTIEDYVSIMDEFTNMLLTSITNIVDFDKVNPGSGGAATAKSNWHAAARALSMHIFGRDIGTANYSNLTDINWLLMESETPIQPSFQPAQDVLILESLFDLYGEPRWGWTDSTSSTNSNADSKAQWYKNLFERMSEGYAVLEDGLASSNEWIQYALESGLVSMEQVDDKNRWNSTMYSNCSSITEVTDNAAVTIAEAEYNAAMNKIENKDKRYDMELKNIDTEHNSLQTEYDSIKTVIDKNVERTFKLYS